MCDTYQAGVDLEGVKKTVQEVLTKNDVKNVAFVGCGASMSELYPAKYFLANNTTKLNVQIFTANEFNYDTPAWIDQNTLVITCSLGGATPETLAANTTAKEHGATVVALTRYAGSALTKNVDFVLTHGHEQNYASKTEKMGTALALSLELLNQTEGYKFYDEMISAFPKVYDIAEKAARLSLLDAQQFAESYKDEPVIYFMGSGASTKVAYSTSMFLIMEMQWVDSGNFNTGEYFHGPFELTQKDKPFVLFMADGKTRPMDARALTFLDRFEAKTTVIDAKDFALSGAVGSELSTYFSPLIHTAVMRMYAEQLAEARFHPLTKRRYMWKLEY